MQGEWRGLNKTTAGPINPNPKECCADCGCCPGRVYRQMRHGLIEEMKMETR